MKLSEGERLILFNQYEILKSMNPEDVERYDLLQTIVAEGYEYNYNELGYFPTVDREVSTFVFDVLSMIDALQISYSKLNQTERESIEEQKLYFKGFDGNNEGEEYVYAMFVIEKLKRYKGIGIEDFNSHSKMINTYKEMIEEWEAYGRSYKLTVEQIHSIIRGYY